MSAAAARRRKQLAAKSNDDTLKQLLASCDSEPTAYEALQLAQSAVRKKAKVADRSACDLAYESSLALLKKGFASVASQLLSLLVEVLRETHTEESDIWIAQLAELHEAFGVAMEKVEGDTEKLRLDRVQRDWLGAALTWSSELGTIRYGHPKLHALAGAQCRKLAAVDTDNKEDLQCDGVQHMALAEQPDEILNFLKTFEKPTEEHTKSGHTCAPATRDSLLTRGVMVFCAVENLRDATKLLRGYAETIEERNLSDLTTSYTKKDDGMAPSHIIFGNMLVRICQKDMRTGPLFQWLMRSFKREMDLFPKPVDVFATRIGKTYFNIQPPPGILNMMENMMGMMGGGGGAGMNPAMMQAALAQMQGMK